MSSLSALRTEPRTTERSERVSMGVFARPFARVAPGCDSSRGAEFLRAPFPPPLAFAKAFSRSSCGRIFSLFSRVMREGLSTGPCAKRGESGLSGPIFSGPHDCAGLVNRLVSYCFVWAFLKAKFDVSLPVAFERWN